MVFLHLNLPGLQHQHQALSPRDNDTHGSWGTTQITIPIMVGVGLIILFAAYIIWDKKRSPHTFQPARLFNQAREACVSRFVHIFMPDRRRRKVQHVSTPVTLDDSMVTPRHIGRHHPHSYIRSDSTDSQTPLTDNAEFYYPPHKPSRRMLEQPRAWRWWRVFRFGPREVKSQVPNRSFQIEGPDESSVGHEDTSLAPAGSGWANGLASLEEQDEGDPGRGVYSRVIQIGVPQTTVCPLTPAPVHHGGDAEVVATPGSYPSSAQTPVPEYSSAVEHPYSTSNSRAMRTMPATVNPQSSHHSLRPALSGSLTPPMYNSVSHTNHPSVESITHPAHSDPMLLYPGSMRAVGRHLPQHIYQGHERQISTDSVLASAKPMMTQSIY